MFTNFRLKMLNRRAASPKYKSDEIIKSLKIDKGDVVADIGAGGGYFTFQFSREVGDEGKVYAVDTNPASLKFIGDEFEKKGINNIITVLANEDGLYLPEKVDSIFLRNVFHHLPEPTEYFKKIKSFLNEDGNLAIIDYSKKGPSFIGMAGHFVPEDVLIDKLEKAGFYPDAKFDFLPDQSFIIFKIKNNQIKEAH